MIGKPVRELSKGLLDELYADKGYICKALTEDLKKDGITLKEHEAKSSSGLGSSDVVQTVHYRDDKCPIEEYSSGRTFSSS